MINLDAVAFDSKIADNKVVVLDVRTPDEYAESHIANSINIDVLSDYFTADISTLDKGCTYAIYCRSGKRSTDAASIMKEFGFTSTFNLTGGITSWIETGKPVVI
jgi:rhodanese-related sulfurtransferase